MSCLLLRLVISMHGLNMKFHISNLTSCVKRRVSQYVQIKCTNSDILGKCTCKVNSFFLCFLARPVLRSHCRFRGLLLGLVTLNNTHIPLGSSGREIGQLQRPLSDSTQHSEETDIHATGAIRTRNPSKRAAADLRFKL